MRAALAVGGAVRTSAPSRLATETMVVCLWAAAGLALTAVAFVAGFGQELAQALSATG